jgi:aminopeptidase N
VSAHLGEVAVSDRADLWTLDRVKPKHYTLSIYDLELGGAFSYQGTVAIQVDIKSETNEITLNTCQLKIHSVELNSGSETYTTSAVTHDERRQRSTLAFEQKLPTGPDAVLTIKFQGTMNNVSRSAGQLSLEANNLPAHVWLLPLSL